MAVKIFAVAIFTLTFIGHVSCFGGNAAALAGATSGFGGTAAGGAFGAPSGFGGGSGLGSLGAIAALGGGEGAGGILRLQLLSQPGFIQQLSQCRLINAIFQG